MVASYTLEQKIGQMLMVGFRGGTAAAGTRVAEDIARYHLGGVWLVDNDTPMGLSYGNIVSFDQVRMLTADLQAAARIPLSIAIDAEGGSVIRLKERYGFPPTLAAEFLGELDDPDLTRRQSATIARLLRQLGITVNFAPVVDLKRNPLNRALGKKRRCFSADARVVVRHATVVVEEHRREGIRCVLKHFPGHGSAGMDSHIDTADVSTSWSDDELDPYRELISQGVAEGVMTSHVILKRYGGTEPATLSSSLISGLLRGRLGFDGVVISDDLNMGAIARHYSLEEAIRASVNAGVDILLNGNVAAYDEAAASKMFLSLRSLVERGRISGDRIETSFRRILRFKGLPDGEPKGTPHARNEEEKA
jgi:beta-N-acetylhexosaminidase